MNRNQTYQKSSYGAVPSDVSSDNNNSNSSPVTTKRSQRRSMILKSAVLAATLVAGVLVGSAAMGYYNSEQYWKDEQNQKKQETKPQNTATVACDNNNNSKVDTEAEQWAKIKQESLRKCHCRYFPLVRGSKHIRLLTNILIFILLSQSKACRTAPSRRTTVVALMLVTTFCNSSVVTPSMRPLPSPCVWVLSIHRDRRLEEVV